MNSTSKLTGFLKTHVRLLVVAVALLALLATATSAFVLQRPIGTHAANCTSTCSATVPVYADNMTNYQIRFTIDPGFGPAVPPHAGAEITSVPVNTSQTVTIKSTAAVPGPFGPYTYYKNMIFFVSASVTQCMVTVEPNLAIAHTISSSVVCS